MCYGINGKQQRYSEIAVLHTVLKLEKPSKVFIRKLEPAEKL